MICVLARPLARSTSMMRIIGASFGSAAQGAGAALLLGGRRSAGGGAGVGSVPGSVAVLAVGVESALGSF